MKSLVAVVVLFACVPVWGQLSNSEIQARLAELNAKAAAKRDSGADSPATQPLARVAVPPAELLAEGISSMRAAKWPEAAALLNRAYRDMPPDQISRALILDRAIVDFVQGANVTRAVKDLSAYLAAHPDDEMAVDLLGAAGHKAIVRRPKFANATLCIEAGKRLESCVGILESRRPGLHKWGAKWMTPGEFASVQLERRRCQDQLDSAMSRVRDAQADVAQAKSEAARYNIITTGVSNNVAGYGSYNNQSEAERLERNRNIAAANDHMSRAQAALDAANASADAIRARFPQPTWPDVFEPVNSDLPATQPAKMPAEAAGSN
jgi:hypothetical protein